MYLLNRWNYETHDYDPFISPSEFLVLVTDNMDLEIGCACCGEKILFGETFTSKEIHNTSGLGFPVCGKCHKQEYERIEQHGNPSM